MSAIQATIDRIRSRFPMGADWMQDRDLKGLLTARMAAAAMRDFRPLGYVLSLAIAPDEIPNDPDHPLHQKGRDTTIRWEADTAPLLGIKGDMLMFTAPMHPLPLTVDRGHPTERGQWKTTPQGEVWEPGHVLYDDAEQVSGELKADGLTRETPDPKYNYGGIKEEDPRRMVTQYHADGVTPLVAGKQLDVDGHTFFLCQPVVQITIKAWADAKRSSLQRLQMTPDRSGRHMAFLFPLLAGKLKAAPAFLIYGSWRSNAREDGN